MHRKASPASSEANLYVSPFCPTLKDSLTANTCSCNLIGLPTFRQRTRKPDPTLRRCAIVVTRRIGSGFETSRMHAPGLFPKCGVSQQVQSTCGLHVGAHPHVHTYEDPINPAQVGKPKGRTTETGFVPCTRDG